MKITILHLSDIHVKSHDDPVLKLAEAIASTCYSLTRPSDICFITVTGDIAYSGSHDEYQAVAPFLQSIKNLIGKEGCPYVEILMVPGNHDCVLIPEKKARSLMISNVIANPEIAEDDTVIEACANAQDNYFIFRDGLTKTIPKIDHKLLTEYEFLVSGKVIRFSAINASWMSRIPEKSGQLIFPANKFREVISEPAELRFVMLHHPLNWYCPDTFHELRTLIRTHATAILSGHEHINHSGEITETNTGTSLYFEANALQPPEAESIAGFAILQFDLISDPELKNVHQTNYQIIGSAINVLDEHDLSLANVNSSLVPQLAFTRGFLKFICDPGGSFIHPDKDTLQIDDLFVYPELKKKSNKEDKTDVEKGQYSIPAEEILFSNKDKFRLIILGEDKAGKSTLIYQALKEFNSRGYAPILLKANDIGSFSESEFKQTLAKCATDQYIQPDHFIRAEKKKRIALVDDLDRLRGGLKMILKFIQLLEVEFDSIIFTATTGFEISELINKEAAKTLQAYTTFEITRFGHALRHKLIRKWCLCGQVGTLTELDRQIYDTENIVNVVVGRNLVPAQPFYLLILLQSSALNQQAELKNSSFTHYYEYLMTGNLKKYKVKKDQYDELFNYLSHLAWFFRASSISEASVSELTSFNIEYTKLIYKVDLQPRVELLVSAKLLRKRGDYYSFAYPYVFFFFLGLYLAKNLYKPEIKNVVTDLCSKLSSRRNAHAILFLTYHVNDPWVIEQVASVLSNCFSAYKPIQMDKDIKSINDLVEETTEQILKIEASNVDENQNEIRKFRDEQDELEARGDELDDDNLVDSTIFRQVNMFIKTAEILGQIVKNYYGSLERTKKKQLITEVFDAPLRFLGCLFIEIQENPDAFILEIEKIALLRNPELKALDKRILLRNIAFQFLGQVCTGIILRSSINIGSENLNDDIKDLIEDKPTAAYKLLGIGTKFISPKNLPLDEIQRLAKELKHNAFAYGILQSLGAMHIHQFHLKIEDQQKLCAALGIRIEASQIIDYRTKDTKLLNK